MHTRPVDQWSSTAASIPKLTRTGFCGNPGFSSALPDSLLQISGSFAAGLSEFTRNHCMKGGIVLEWPSVEDKLFIGPLRAKEERPDVSDKR